jgi:type II secretory pathway component PulF
MAEQGVSFKSALEKLIKYLEVKDAFQRESNDKISLPVIYFTLASITVFGVKFFAVPYQIGRSHAYSKEIVALIAGHLQVAQFMTDILFFTLVIVGSYFLILLLSLFNQSYFIQATAKQLALLLPFSAAIVIKFEKFMLFSMLGEMLQSGISFKKAMQSAIETTTVNRFKNAMQESLDSIKHNGKFILHTGLYDDVEKGLLTGIGSSSQVGSVMLEISDRARTDALELSTKFFRMITLFSILLMAFAVFIEFFTVVLTQILIQKGLIDATRGVGTF